MNCYRSIKRVIYFVLLWTLYSQSAPAQGTTKARQEINLSAPIRPLKIGDKVPDLLIADIINYRTTTARLSDFKGKVVVIDFWGTNCPPCLLALPKIDSLQKKLSDRLQVLTVTNHDTKEKVVRALQRNKRTKDVSLPVILNDHQLKQYFPHEYISHVVWIGPDGIVKAITGTEYVTAENIQLVTSGKTVDWPVKNDLADFDYEKPLLTFTDNRLTTPPVFYSSAFTGYLEGVAVMDKLVIDSTKKTKTWSHFNQTLLQLCDGSLSGGGTGYINPKLLILEVPDRTRYLRDEHKDFNAAWVRKNAYCYSITMPLSTSDVAAEEIVKKDLTHWLQVLNIEVKKETRPISCLRLIRTRQDDRLLVSKGGPLENGLNGTDPVKRLRNFPFVNLLWYLNEDTKGIPWVLDETNLPADFNVDMDLTINSLQNIPALRMALQQYGLDLVEATKEMELYVIREIGSKN